MSGSASSGHRRQLNEEKKEPGASERDHCGLCQGARRSGLDGRAATPPTPRGLANVSGVQSITNGAAGATQSSIKWANLIAAWSAIRAADGPVPTAAIMAPRALTGYAALADSTGQPMLRPDLLRTMPFYDTSAVPINQTVTSSTDCNHCVHGRLHAAMFGMREQVSIMRASELFATTGQVGFICHLRADFQVEFAAALAGSSPASGLPDG